MRPALCVQTETWGLLNQNLISQIIETKFCLLTFFQTKSNQTIKLPNQRCSELGKQHVVCTASSMTIYKTKGRYCKKYSVHTVWCQQSTPNMPALFFLLTTENDYLSNTVKTRRVFTESSVRTYKNYLALAYCQGLQHDRED